MLLSAFVIAACFGALSADDSAEQSPLYDPAAAQASRLKHYKEACARYKDPALPEYKALFTGHIELNKVGRNIPKKYFVCVPPKVASSTWLAQTKMLLAADYEKYGAEAVNAMLMGPQVTMDDYKQGTRSIVVRHPLERLLSSYLFTFFDGTTHRDLTRKVREQWLEVRPDHLKKTDDEEDGDFGGHQSLTFRQFINFLTHCPEDYEECRVLTVEGIAEHWSPYWRYCKPCLEGYEPHFIIHGDHMDEDKHYVFDQVGLNNTFPLRVQNPTKKASASSKDTKKKYFGQLTQQEIYDIYLKYKLDHDLFGFSPDEYLAMAKDANSN